MSSSLSAAVAMMMAALAAAASAQERFPGIGRAATAAEVAAWDIDVRPDFRGLPPGRGSVADGQAVWESRCAGCHGVFGESNEFFSPLVGGTTAEDVRTGRVARLRDADYPQRTTMMKLAQLSTLWDYIRRAMPWTAPKSLTHDEVYAVTAYLLHLGDVLPADFVLSQRNVREVQARLPNRDGLVTDHALWPGRAFGLSRKPDVQGDACMRDCPGMPVIASSFPEHARGLHGNLALQQRLVGPQRGRDTDLPVGGSRPANAERRPRRIAGPSQGAGPGPPRRGLPPLRRPRVQVNHERAIAVACVHALLNHTRHGPHERRHT